MKKVLKYNLKFYLKCYLKFLNWMKFLVVCMGFNGMKPANLNSNRADSAIIYYKTHSYILLTFKMMNINFYFNKYSFFLHLKTCHCMTLKQYKRYKFVWRWRGGDAL